MTSEIMTSEIVPLRPMLHAVKSTVPPLDSILQKFEGSSLEQLDRVALLNRTDTKFLLGESVALSILPELFESYRMLDIRGIRQHRYRTIYFDTPLWHLYEQHRTAQIIRHKVRSRAYLDSGTSFLEVKSKDNQGRTIKVRTATPELMTELTPAGVEFVTPFLELDAASLHLVLQNEFTRITLVHKEDAERLTLDFGLRFEHNGMAFSLPGVVIAEVKQSGLNPESPFLQSMTDIEEPPSSVSKYCVGVARLYPDIDSEAFGTTLTALDLLMATESSSG